MKNFKDVWCFLKKPNKKFTILSYCLFVLFTIMRFVFLSLNLSTTIMSIVFSGMGITFFYCCYLFIMYDFKKIKTASHNAKVRMSNKSKLLNKLFNDTYFRTVLATIFSLFLGVCFIGYNAFAGIYYHSIWNGSISVYYFFLVIIRIIFLISEYKIKHNQSIQEQEIELKRAKMFKLEGILLILVNIALIAPITLLALSQRDVNLPMWVAIANACYAFYKMTVCIYSFVKSRNNKILSIKGIKNLNLTSACVTLLSLENTMIITFSEGIDNSMRALTITSAFAVMIINLYIAISTLVVGNKIVKQIKEQKD